MNLTVLASGSAGNCYVLKIKDDYILLDAGIRTEEILPAINWQPSCVAGVLLTHEHKDHGLAVSELMNKRGITIYTTLGTAEALQLRSRKLAIVEALKPFKVSSSTSPKVLANVVPVATVHDAAEPCGFLLSTLQGDKIAYFTDTAYIKANLTGLTHLIVECNYMSADLKRAENNLPAAVRNRIASSHLSAENLAAWIKAMDKSRLRLILLAHISQDRGDAAAMRQYISWAAEGVRVEVATPGFKFNDGLED